MKPAFCTGHTASQVNAPTLVFEVVVRVVGVEHCNIGGGLHRVAEFLVLFDDSPIVACGYYEQQYCSRAAQHDSERMLGKAG